LYLRLLLQDVRRWFGRHIGTWEASIRDGPFTPWNKWPFHRQHPLPPTRRRLGCEVASHYRYTVPAFQFPSFEKRRQLPNAYITRVLAVFSCSVMNNHHPHLFQPLRPV